jgi:phosphoglycolate phosphatase
MDHLGLTPFFPTILGGDSLAVRKPHPDHLRATSRALGRSQSVFVGDSEVDAETAHAAGVPFVLYTEGYRKSPLDQIVHSVAFDDWANLPSLVTIWG